MWDRAKAVRAPGRVEVFYRRPALILIGRFWPTKRNELLSLSGGRLVEQLYKFALPRFSTFAVLKTPAPLLGGLEPFEGKALLLADPEQEIRFHDRLVDTTERLAAVEVEALIEIAREMPAIPPVGKNDSAGTAPDEALVQFQAKVRSFVERTPAAAPLFQGLARSPRVLVAEMARVKQVFDVQTKGNAPAPIERARHLQQTVRTQKEGLAATFTKEITPFASSYAALLAMQENAGAALDKVHILNVPNVEQAVAQWHRQIVDEVLELQEPVTEIVLMESIKNLDSLKDLAAYFETTPELFGGVYTGFDGYTDADQLLNVLRHNPRKQSIGAGHIWPYAGKAKHRGVPVSVGPPIVGRRTALSGQFIRTKRLYGPLQPLFGAHAWCNIYGLDDIDTIRWREKQVKEAAKEGVNVLWKYRSGNVAPYASRTRSSLADWSQIHLVSFTENLSGQILAHLEEQGIGLVNDETTRRHLCDEAATIYLAPFHEVAGFGASLEPAPSNEPTELAIAFGYTTTDPIESVKMEQSRIEQVKGKK